ncbi:MAG: DUF2298 domain-containing protein [Anaerolineales bacterium]
MDWRKLSTACALAVVLVGAAYLRFVGLNWDSFQHLHPDERFLTMVETSIAPVRGGLSEYFDTDTSTLNPYNSGHGFFVYGTAPIFIVRYTADIINVLRTEWLVSESGWRAAVAGWLLGAPDAPGPLAQMGAGYDQVHLVGRAVSALSDIAAIAILFLVALRLYRDRRVALLAALLSAFAVLQIQQSHFFTVDAVSNVFVVGGIYFAARALDDMRWRNYLLFGVMLGLSVASRINTAPLALTIALAAFGYLVRAHRTETELSSTTMIESPLWRPLLLRLAAAAGISLLVFRIGQPYAFQGPSIFSLSLNEQWLNNMREIRGQVGGDVDFPPNHQWTNRPALIFPFENMVRWGMGYALGLTVWAGMAVAGWQMLRGRWRRHLIPVVWSGLYFAWQGTQWVKPMRYFLPIYPTLILLGAWLLVYLWDRAAARVAETTDGNGSIEAARLEEFWRRNLTRLPTLPRGAQRIISLALIIIVVAASGAWAFAFSRIYTRPVTRVAASEWIYQNVPGPINLEISSPAGETQIPLAVPYDYVFQDGQTFEQQFVAREDGVLQEIFIPHLGDPSGDAAAEQFIITVDGVSGGSQGASAAAVLNTDLAASDDPRGGGYTLQLDRPLELRKGEGYRIGATALAGGPVSIAGATVVNETSWDDGLPLRFGGYDAFGGLYTGLNFELYWEDDETKLDRMLDYLEQADYIFISSNRQYGSIPRLPMRYPLTIRYYEALFSGELGFDPVYVNESAPSIGPFVISDQDAEEPFTVYDHPKVLIFKKSDAYSPEQARAILGSVDLSEVVFMIPSEVTAAPTALFLPEDRLAEQRAGGTWSESFDASNLLNSRRWLGVIVWWEVAQLMGWLLFPLVFLALRGLPDKVAKTAALLATAWGAWLLASARLLDYSGATLWFVFGLLVLLSVVVFVRQRTAITMWVRTHWRYAVVTEAVFLVFFGVFLYIRWRNPDLWHPSYGGEKPMDFSYFNAVLRSTSFPPYDPWFAGGYINYYYFGFVIVGALTKMLGIVPAFAYNLILPLWFALTATGAFGAAYNLVAFRESTAAGVVGRRASPYLAGIGAATLMALLGNLGQLDTFYKAILRVTDDVQAISIPVLEQLQRTAIGLYRIVVEQRLVPIGTGEWYWNATRIIPTTGGETVPITEFPFFTFLYADLHAHLIVLPLTLLAIAWALSTVFDARRTRRFGESALHWVLGGLVIGVLGPTNTWDLPTYLALGAVALGYAELRRRQKFDFDWLVGSAWRVLLLVVLANAFFSPFSKWFGTGYGSIELWSGSNTTLTAYLKIHGLFLFLIVTLLLMETRRWMQQTTLDQLDGLRDLAGPVIAGLSLFAVVVLVLWLVFDIHIAPVVLPLILWTGLLMVRPGQSPERRAVFGLVGLGLVLTLSVELVRLEGDIARMNTVFKFYLQVWTMFSVAAGAALAWVWPQLDAWRSGNARAWRAGLAALVFAAGLYTVLAGAAKMRDRMAPDAPATLDGLAYMKYARYNDQGQEIALAPDYDAIRWMQDNVVGSPVIVEVNATEYKYGSRFTINTGLPGVVGWNWHQRQQRSVVPPSLVTDRVNDIAAFYATTDLAETTWFLEKYDVEYIIMGGYERAYYGDAPQAKFDQMAASGQLEVAYRNDSTVIYEVANLSAQ